MNIFKDDTNSMLLLIVIGLVLLKMILPMIEHAGSPGTLTQLATSSVNPNSIPYGTSPWLVPVTPQIRPVMQRGMYFGAPSYHR